MASQTHFKFIEWQDTDGLHKDITTSILDLDYLKDELRFLENLVSENTIEFIYQKKSLDTKAIINELTGHSKRLSVLTQKFKNHNSNLEKLIESGNDKGELQLFKNEHYALVIEEMDFHADLKKTKSHIFKMLAEIMKKSKQKKIL
jgi:hypothetical protein